MDENSKMKLTIEQLDKVSGGDFTVSDEQGNVIVSFSTLEEAKFFVSGLCPRCGKTFASESDRLNHIKAWASGQK